AAGCSRAQDPSGASPARSSARQTPGATDNTSPRSPRSGGLRPPSSGPAKPEHRLAAASQRSLQACIASLPLQSSWMSKTYLKSDHFNGGGSWAGVSPAAPYRHFRDRDELLVDVARRSFDHFEVTLARAWDDGRPDAFRAFDRLEHDPFGQF